MGLVLDRLQLYDLAPTSSSSSGHPGNGANDESRRSSGGAHSPGNSPDHHYYSGSSRAADGHDRGEGWSQGGLSGPSSRHTGWSSQPDAPLPRNSIDRSYSQSYSMPSQPGDQAWGSSSATPLSRSQQSQDPSQPSGHQPYGRIDLPYRDLSGGYSSSGNGGSRGDFQRLHGTNTDNSSGSNRSSSSSSSSSSSGSTSRYRDGNTSQSQYRSALPDELSPYPPPMNAPHEYSAQYQHHQVQQPPPPSPFSRPLPPPSARVDAHLVGQPLQPSTEDAGEDDLADCSFFPHLQPGVFHSQ